MDKGLDNNLNLEYKQKILENHLYFLLKHRGLRESFEYGEVIHSDKANFNIVFLLSNEGVEKINKEYTVYLPDWVTLSEQMKLKYKKTGSLIYMVLADGEPEWEINKTINIMKVDTLSGIEDFSIVQGRGFCETEEEFNMGYPWMREKNIKNFDESNQNFYVAYENGNPVGVVLCIYYKNIAGIYAVATLPEYRKKGISTTLIQRAVNDAIINNITTITLQTATGSYSHSLYKKLGFKDLFECSILKTIR